MGGKTLGEGSHQPGVRVPQDAIGQRGQDRPIAVCP
jgi:hypothetical protein